jgi:hypothetical protein
MRQKQIDWWNYHDHAQRGPQERAIGVRYSQYVNPGFSLLPFQVVMADDHPCRSWRAIARELAKETNPSRMAKLRRELNRVLNEEAPIQVTPYNESSFPHVLLGTEIANVAH